MLQIYYVGNCATERGIRCYRYKNKDKDINQVLQTSGTDIRIILDKNSIKMKYSKQTLKLHVSVIVRHIFEALRLQKSD